MWVFFLFKLKTAYEMRISDWSSDVCSSDLGRSVAPCDETQARLKAGPTQFPSTYRSFARMTATRTFSIIKPDATRRNLPGAVTKMLQDAGLSLVASRRIKMTKEQDACSNAVHKERPYFNDLRHLLTSA